MGGAGRLLNLGQELSCETFFDRVHDIFTEHFTSRKQMFEFIICVKCLLNRDPKSFVSDVMRVFCGRA